MPHPRWSHFGESMYVEARMRPEPSLRFFRVSLTKPAVWVCLGIGLASITIGCDLVRKNRHTKRHTSAKEEPKEAA